MKVANLNRAIELYCGVLGFDVMQRYGDEAAFLSADNYHHPSLSEIKYECSDDAGRRGRALLRCSLGRELVASSAHPCSRTGVFGSDCSSSHNSAADGEGGALPRQSRDPNSPVGSNRSPIRNNVLPG